MYSDDVVYKTPENFDIISYMDIVADELKSGISLFKSKNEKIVAVFGSARTKSNDKEYLIAEETGKKLVENGFSVITGGGPGIMEAALKGAFLKHGDTYIKNGYVCKHLFTRKVLLTRNVCGYIVLPGGFGTLDELFDVLTLMNTKIQNQLPLVLLGIDFWSGLIEWMKDKLLSKHYIREDELECISLTDSVDEAVNIIKG